MVGLHCLKALYDESDESVVAKWVENPYWQYFCGETMFQHELPYHPTSLVKWRKQVGTEGIELLLGQVVRSAMSTAMLRPREIERVNVDATVQEKAVAFPTDALALSAGEEDAGTRGKKEKYKIASKLCPRWQVRFLQAKSLGSCAQIKYRQTDKYCPGLSVLCPYVTVNFCRGLALLCPRQ